MIYGHSLEILNYFILEYVPGSSIVHLFLSLHYLEESFDSWVPGTLIHLAFPSSHLPNPFLPLLPQTHPLGDWI